MALVTMSHIRELGYCASGLRRWCAQHDIDIREFSSGIPSERLKAMGDGFALKAAELAEREQHGVR